MKTISLLFAAILLLCLIGCSSGNDTINEVPVIHVRVISVDGGDLMVVTDKGVHAELEGHGYHTPVLQPGNLMTLERWDSGMFVYRGDNEEGKPDTFHYWERAYAHNLEDK